LVAADKLDFLTSFYSFILETFPYSGPLPP